MLPSDIIIYAVAGVAAVWVCSAIASHAWHTVKFAMIRRIGIPTPMDRR